MRYLVRGTNEAGDPVDVVLEVCWRCGVPVSTMHVPMAEHVENMHPPDTGWTPDDGGRHVYVEPATVPELPVPSPRPRVRVESDPLFGPLPQG